VCRRHRRTFSVLPTQLIPYHQYTADAVSGALLLGLECRRSGQKGYHGATLAVDPESFVTPWLIATWLSMVVMGFRRAHSVLSGFYNLAGIHIESITGAWAQLADYFTAWGLRPQTRWGPVLQGLLSRYSLSCRLFLLGSPSQYRRQPAATIRP
jgi:hypothetical protein